LFSVINIAVKLQFWCCKCACVKTVQQVWRLRLCHKLYVHLWR